MELCALCAVPKASFTKISAKEANFFESSSSFFSSPASNLTFSRSITCPSFKFEALATASGPTTSFESSTSIFNNLDNSLATTSKENSGFISPFGLPKCEQRITLQLFSNKYLIVGSAATILLLSTISLFSFNGTLKSHLTKTFFP